MNNAKKMTIRKVLKAFKALLKKNNSKDIQDYIKSFEHEYVIVSLHNLQVGAMYSYRLEAYILKKISDEHVFLEDGPDILKVSKKHFIDNASLIF